MRRVVVYNHIRSRPLGKFRATATDHGADCHCGGSCDSCKEHSRLGQRDRFQRDAYEKTDLGIDVKYAKGVMGRKEYTTRHYVIPDFLVDLRGQGPQPGAVATELRRYPEHIAMVRSGWTVEKAEGYYKQSRADMRDLGRKEI